MLVWAISRDMPMLLAIVASALVSAGTTPLTVVASVPRFGNIIYFHRYNLSIVALAITLYSLSVRNVLLVRLLTTVS